MLNFVKGPVFGSFLFGFAIGAALLVAANPMTLTPDANAQPVNASANSASSSVSR